MNCEIMPPLRGSDPISRSRTWGWHPRLQHNTASRFKKKRMYNNEPSGVRAELVYFHLPCRNSYAKQMLFTTQEYLIPFDGCRRAD